MFFKSLEEAVGSVEDMSTLYSAIGDAGLSSYLGNSKTVATLFAPSDDVSCAASSSMTSYCYDAGNSRQTLAACEHVRDECRCQQADQQQQQQPMPAMHAFCQTSAKQLQPRCLVIRILHSPLAASATHQGRSLLYTCAYNTTTSA
jgi:hypothetical protein